ncbi:hypothetical protein TSAR_009217 [Trichomalopsis sarcophagae]|uniref:Uncharacterized protein n=1 Tax=Trichomalopsis sarcophagae TaxID=543379 RepID=A0A232FE87_9HYME|nr:hypothetical protein TSAR_009217 [Trichomalopsis sarcophagae]
MNFLGTPRSKTLLREEFPPKVFYGYNVVFEPLRIRSLESTEANPPQPINLRFAAQPYSTTANDYTSETVIISSPLTR